jgi:DNA-binding transcriptional ArsR family regulator
VNQLSDGIRLVFPSQPLEQTRLGTSRVLEAAHSWHVLADPSHHALHLPWVRACRRLPAGLRQQLREHSWAAHGYLPAFLEAGIAHPDATIDEEVALIRAVPIGQLLPELVLTLADWPRDADFSDQAVQGRVIAIATDQNAALLRQVFADPAAVRDRLLEVITSYWRACFAAEFQRLEPKLHQAMEDAARHLASTGPLGLLHGLLPEVILDPAAHAVLIPRSHSHQVDVGEHGGITLVPSVYAWPHARVTCDHPPWPLTLIYPVDPLIRPLAPPLTPGQLARQLRAVAAEPRLELLHLASIEPRSTQELARLTQLSEAAVSKHLQTLLSAGLLTRRRDGYYVLYAVSRDNLIAFTQALASHLNAPALGTPGPRT